MDEKSITEAKGFTKDIEKPEKMEGTFKVADTETIEFLEESVAIAVKTVCSVIESTSQDQSFIVKMSGFSIVLIVTFIFAFMFYCFYDDKVPELMAFLDYIFTLFVKFKGLV